jgi:uncharacterized UPF0146 family protein
VSHIALGIQTESVDHILASRLLLVNAGLNDAVDTLWEHNSWPVLVPQNETTRTASLLNEAFLKKLSGKVIEIESTDSSADMTAQKYLKDNLLQKNLKLKRNAQLVTLRTMYLPIRGQSVEVPIGTFAEFEKVIKKDGKVSLIIIKIEISGKIVSLNVERVRSECAGNSNIYREQFPVTLAYALRAKEWSSMTLDGGVCIFNETLLCGEATGMLSRFKRLDSMAILCCGTSNGSVITGLWTQDGFATPQRVHNIFSYLRISNDTLPQPMLPPTTIDVASLPFVRPEQPSLQQSFLMTTSL